MLTRFVRIQLIIFTIASIVGVAVMVFAYMQVPTLLGVGRINVKLELPAAGGLYRFSNVTYRGVQVGKVTDVKLTENGAEATLTLDTSPKIPADLQAEVRSVSAVGEQYVDLRPRTDSGPYLEDGSVIAMDNTTIPQRSARCWIRSARWWTAFRRTGSRDLLDESFKAFNGAGYDFQSLLDSASTITRDLNGVSDQTRGTDRRQLGRFWIRRPRPPTPIRTWARSLAGVTEQVAQNDPQIRAHSAARTRLRAGGFAAAESGQADAADAAGEPHHGRSDPRHLQPVARTASGAASRRSSRRSSPSGLPKNNPTGLPLGDFALTISDPPPCTVGFLPPSQWRNPGRRDDHRHPGRAVLQAAAGLADRRARCPQLPVHGAPGKRAPTVELCNDPRGFVPTGDAPAHPRAVSIRSESDRAGRPARRPRRLQRPDLRAGARARRCRPVPFRRERRQSAPGPAAPAPVPVQAPLPPPPPPGNSINGTPVPAVPVPPGAVPAAPSAFGGNGSQAPVGRQRPL